jgi:hypothetical protein
MSLTNSIDVAISAWGKPISIAAERALSFFDGGRNRCNGKEVTTIKRSEAQSNQNISGAIRKSITKIEPISTPIEMKIASG